MQVRILPPLPISLPGSSGNPSLAASEDHRAYSYLLGAYLGDGYLCRMPRTWRLEVYLHRDDTPTIDRVRTAISALLPGRRVGLRAHGAALVVTSYFKGWPALFPQHGAGLKHTRPTPVRRSLQSGRDSLAKGQSGDHLHCSTRGRRSARRDPGADAGAWAVLGGARGRAASLLLPVVRRDQATDQEGRNGERHHRSRSKVWYRVGYTSAVISPS